MLKNSVPWFGQHTGYEILLDHFTNSDVSIRTVVPGDAPLQRAIGKVASVLRGHGSIAQGNAYARTKAEILLRTSPRRRLHILYGEDHATYWRDVPRSLLDRTIITLHQPPSQFSAKTAESLAKYRHVIVLWQKDLEWFRSKVGNGRVAFIHHGVDVEFFRPAPTVTAAPVRFLYSGVHLRNCEMLARMVEVLHRQHPDLCFDLLVPDHRRNEPALRRLQGHSAVTFHSGLDDRALQNLYQRAYALLLPMNASGANTAIVEALACGLPVITTDVGGIRDYGGGNIFPVVNNNDDPAMLALIEEYLRLPDWRAEIGIACRAFAENNLAWPLIASKHLDFYRGC